MIHLFRTFASSRLAPGLLGAVDTYYPHYRADQDYCDRENFCQSHPFTNQESFQPQHWLAIKQLTLEHYRYNLTRLFLQTAARDIPVLFLTVPLRYRLPVCFKHKQPYHLLSLAEPEEKKFMTLFNAAGQAQKKGEWARAIDLYQAALAIDPNSSFIYYQLGQTYEARQEFQAARAAYYLAREQMIGNLGAIQSINATIRDVSQRLQAGLVDAVAAFESAADQSQDYFGERLMIDDCHLSAKGHAIMAESVAQFIQAHSQEIFRQ
jgi:tetratricopeptide (TPR) repeat protein